MKIILVNDVSGLGKKGDLLTVANGFARNFLIPQGKAVRATAGTERLAEDIRKTRELKAAKDLQTAQEISKRLSSVVIKLGARASEEGSLYGSVTVTDIANALDEQFKVQLQKNDINLKEPIRQLGKYKVEIITHKDVSFDLAVEIVAV